MNTILMTLVSITFFSLICVFLAFFRPIPIMRIIPVSMMLGIVVDLNSDHDFWYLSMMGHIFILVMAIYHLCRREHGFSMISYFFPFWAVILNYLSDGRYITLDVPTIYWFLIYFLGILLSENLDLRCYFININLSKTNYMYNIIFINQYTKMVLKKSKY